MIKIDDYDDCIAGICTRFGQPAILIYDRAKVIHRLQAEGMTEVEAEEHMEFNMVGSWVGDETPAFIAPFDPLDEELLSEPARRPKKIITVS